MRSNLNAPYMYLWRETCLLGYSIFKCKFFTLYYFEDWNLLHWLATMNWFNGVVFTMKGMDCLFPDALSRILGRCIHEAWTMKIKVHWETSPNSFSSRIKNTTPPKNGAYIDGWVTIYMYKIYFFNFCFWNQCESNSNEKLKPHCAPRPEPTRCISPR